MIRARTLVVCLAALVLGCGSADAPVASSPATPVVLPCTPLPPIQQMVRRQGTELLVGDQPFRALGGNAYYLQQLYTYGEIMGPAWNQQAAEALDAIACLSMNVVRTLAFNDTQDGAAIRTMPGQFQQPGLRGVDRAVAEAKARGLRVILTLTNNWPDFGGLDAYARWAGKSHDDFFTDATMQGYWKELASTLLARVNTVTGVAYKDEPAIFGWEIGNELRCRTCRGPDKMVETIRALAAHLRAQGARQLILDGGEGFDDVDAPYAGLSTSYPVKGEEGASFSRLTAIADLDLLSYHLYPESWGLTDRHDAGIWIDAHQRLAHDAGKLAYLGEFGSDPTMAMDLDRRDSLRATTFAPWLARLFDTAHGSLALLWQNIPPERRLTADDGYGVVYGQDHRTVKVLYDQAVRVR